MSNFSDFVGGLKPKRVTVYTSGTGTFTPLVSGSWCRITMVGGGGGGGKPGGASFGGAGGSAGVTLPGIWMRIDSAIAYAVGAAGVGATVGDQPGTAGGNTTLGSLIAPGGPGPVDYLTANPGGKAGSVNAAGDSYGISGAIVGGAGGSAPSAGSSSTPGNAGWRPGFALVTTIGGNGPAGGAGGTAAGGGGGGSSVYGTGGTGGANGGAPGAASGYGAGGGGGSNPSNGGNGTGGLIIIEEFGAF